MNDLQPAFTLKLYSHQQFNLLLLAALAISFYRKRQTVENKKYNDESKQTSSGV